MADDRIRIRDLAKPELNDLQKAGLAYADSLPLDLGVDAVLARARKTTGLDDFGPDDFRERLALWLSEPNQDPDRTNLGRLMLLNDCMRWAATRLRIRQLLKEHPEIHDVEIRAPIIVVGLPRSGTTHLVNLIAADSRLRSMPLWEGQAPVAEHNASRDRNDPRWIRPVRGFSPHFVPGLTVCSLSDVPRTPLERLMPRRCRSAPSARLRS